MQSLKSLFGFGDTESSRHEAELKRVQAEVDRRKARADHLDGLHQAHLRRQRSLEAAQRKELEDLQYKGARGAGYDLARGYSENTFGNNPILFPHRNIVDETFFHQQAARLQLEKAMNNDGGLNQLMSGAGGFDFAQDLRLYNLIASKGKGGNHRYYHHSLTLVLLLAQPVDHARGPYQILTERKHMGHSEDALDILRRGEDTCYVYRVYRGHYSNNVTGTEELRHRFLWGRQVVRYWLYILGLAYRTYAGNWGYASDPSLFGCVPHAVYAAGLGDSVARFMREQLLIPDARAMHSWLETSQMMIELIPKSLPGTERPPWWLLWRPFNTHKPHHTMGMSTDSDWMQTRHLLLVCGNAMYRPLFAQLNAAVGCTPPVYEWAPFVPPGGERGSAARLTANDLAYILLARIIYLAAKHYPNFYTLRLSRYREQGNERAVHEAEVVINA